MTNPQSINTKEPRWALFLFYIEKNSQIKKIMDTAAWKKSEGLDF